MRIPKPVLFLLGVYTAALAPACGGDDDSGPGAAAGSGAKAGSSSAGSGGQTGTQPEYGQAIAVIAPFGDGTVTGTAAFLRTDDQVSVVVALNNCPDGLHGVHIHQGTSCDDADAQGGHWDMTRGEGIPKVMCADGKGTSMTSRGPDDPSLAWSIGGNPTTSIVGHVIVVHNEGDPAPRIGCGPITTR